MFTGHFVVLRPIERGGKFESFQLHRTQAIMLGRFVAK